MATDKFSRETGRRVATEAGAKFFGKPVGSPITVEDEENAKGRNQPVTLHRLKSLQRQFIQAKRTENRPLMTAVNKQFSAEMKIYLEISGESASKVLDDMDADYDEGLKESTELNDRDTADGNKPEPKDDSNSVD